MGKALGMPNAHANAHANALHDFHKGLDLDSIFA
jgi:hypothetical protein